MQYPVTHSSTHPSVVIEAGRRWPAGFGGNFRSSARATTGLLLHATTEVQAAGHSGPLWNFPMAGARCRAEEDGRQLRAMWRSDQASPTQLVAARILVQIFALIFRFICAFLLFVLSKNLAILSVVVPSRTSSSMW